MLLPKCATCDSKKPIFIKKGEPSKLLNCLGLKTPSSIILLIADTLFQIYKMKEIINNFLLAGEKFMPEIHLRQPEFTYSTFFYLGFLSRTFTIHRTAGEGEGYLFNFSLPLTTASQTLIH